MTKVKKKDSFKEIYDLSVKIINKVYSYEQLHMYKKDFYKHLDILSEFIKENNLENLQFLSDYEKWYISKNYVVLVFNDTKVPIKIQGDVSITENPENVCIVKKHNVQYVVPANSYELKYKIILRAKKILDNVIYKIGERIVLHSMKGSYIIEDINSKNVLLTCKKWKYEKKAPMIKPISDIKGLFTQDYLPF